MGLMDHTTLVKPGSVEYVDCISAEGLESPLQMSIQGMTLNHLMVRFQSWTCGECFYSHAHFDSEL